MTDASFCAAYYSGPGGDGPLNREPSQPKSNNPRGNSSRAGGAAPKPDEARAVTGSDSTDAGFGNSDWVECGASGRGELRAQVRPEPLQDQKQQQRCQHHRGFCSLPAAFCSRPLSNRRSISSAGAAVRQSHVIFPLPRRCRQLRRTGASRNSPPADEQMANSTATQTERSSYPGVIRRLMALAPFPGATARPLPARSVAPRSGPASQPGRVTASTGATFSLAVRFCLCAPRLPRFGKAFNEQPSGNACRSRMSNRLAGADDRLADP
jgi:hypothetical protein